MGAMLAVTAALGLTLLAFAVARRAQQRETAAEFAADARDRAETIERHFGGLQQMAMAIQGFYAASDEVDAEEFRTFVAPYLAEAPGVVAAAWLPRVAAAGRDQFEAALRRLGNGAAGILERAADGGRRPASPRSEHDSIAFLESADGSRRDLGFDLAADAEFQLRGAIARDSGDPVAIGPAALGLIDAPDERFLILVPTYRKGTLPTTITQRRERFIGFAVVEVDVSALLDAALGRLAPRGVNVRLEQSEGSSRGAVAAAYVSRLGGAEASAAGASGRPVPDRPRRVDRFDALGRSWIVSCEPSPGRAVESAVLAWVSLAVGLAFTGLLAVYLAVGARRNARLVKAHESLRAANAELARTLVERSQLEARNAAIVSTAQDAIVTADGHGVILSWNRAAERIFGYSADEVVGANMLDVIVPPRYRELKRAKMAEFRRAGEGTAVGKTLELSALRRDGSEFPIALSLSVYAQADDFVAVCVIRDITEQQAARRELERRTGELNRRVKELDCLSSALRLLADEELPLDALLGRIVDLIPLALRHPELACCRLVVGETEAATANFARTRWRMAIPIRFHGAQIGSCEVCYLAEPPRPEAAFLDEERALVSTLAEQLGKAVEQRRAHSEVRSLKQQIEFVLGATRTGLNIFDADFNLVYVDPFWEQRHGPYVGKKCYEYFADRAEPCPNCPGAEALCTKKTVVREAVLPKEDNRPVQVTSLPYQDERGRWLVADVNVDLTERKRLERHQAETRRLESIGQLAAGIAHEINTPIQFVGDNIRFLAEAFDDLQAIIEAARQLEQTVAGDDGATARPLGQPTETRRQRLAGSPEESRSAQAGAPATNRSGSPSEPAERAPRSLSRESDAALAALLGALGRADLDFLAEEAPNAIAQSLEGVDRVAGIVRAMKEFAQPAGGEKKLVDLNRMVENLLLISRNEWKQVADATAQLDPELPHVPCLHGEMNQALLNLVVNAAEAIKAAAERGLRPKGTITLRTRRTRNWAEIEIEDTGVGIPESLRDRIFDPFFTTKEVGQGTGSGLSQVHSVVVDRHGGSLTFESRVGEGTKFLIRLPLETSTDARGGVPPISPAAAAPPVAEVPALSPQPEGLATP